MGRLSQLVPMTEPEQLTEPENTESVQPQRRVPGRPVGAG